MSQDMPLKVKFVLKVADLLGYETHIAQVPSYLLPDFIQWNKDDHYDSTIFTFRKKESKEDA